AGPLFERAFDRWFEEQLAAPAPGVARVLRRRGRADRAGRGAADEGPRGLLCAAARNLVERRDFPAPWRCGDGFDREREIDGLLEEMAALGARAADGDPDDWFTKSLDEIRRVVREVTRRVAVQARDYDGIETRLVSASRGRQAKHWNWRGYQEWSRKSELRERRDALHARLLAFVERAGADLAPKLRDELWPIVGRYEDLKQRAGCLDFLDLLLRARDLVRDNRGARVELQRRFTHLLVDEFQDTDPLQAELLLLLAASDPAETDWRRVRPAPGKLFVVGDPRQSIYRFRRADVALYEGVKRQILASGGALVELVTSFRAVPEIQLAVNAAFAPRMRGESPDEPRYAPLSPFRTDVEGQPVVVALPVPRPYGRFGRIVDWQIEESLPDAVAAFVAWLVRSSGWTVSESGESGRRVPVEPRHVCLLFRRMRSFFTDVTRPYVRALEARRLPHVLVGGTSFHVREEVEAIRNALAAIERPDDELSVFATLRGPLFAIGDGPLLAFRELCGSLHPFRRLMARSAATETAASDHHLHLISSCENEKFVSSRSEPLPPEIVQVAEALTVLRDLHVGRNRRPIADTIGRLLGATRAHAGLAILPTGEQALANVVRLSDLARRFERAGGISFRGFVDWLADEAERGEASDAPIIEEGTDGVRIMTVH
ncbi:MAG: UvrD-helicase domain-containing protein, partial [Candidatus Binatia bacterium]